MQERLEAIIAGFGCKKADLTRCDLGACFAAFDAWQRQLQVVQPVGFGFIQPLQLVADLSQQVFPPSNIGVGFDAQRRGAIDHA